VLRYFGDMETQQTKVVVSLTTLPGREALVERTLRSLREQTRRPEQTYVWLPEGRQYSKIPACPGLDYSLARTPDLGPATKLIPTLTCETRSDTLIITVDDDVAYPPRLVEKLVEAASMFPTCAIGFTGWQVVASDDEPIVHHFNQETPYSGFFHLVDVLEGHRGVVYRREFFSEDVHRHLASCEAFRYHDDIFFGGYLANQGIHRLVRWFDPLEAPMDDRWQIGCQDSGLHTTRDWRQLGKQCWDYWATAFALAGGDSLPERLAPRIRFTCNQRGDGFSLAGHVSAYGGSGQVLTEKSKPADSLPWPDESFSELIVDAHVRDWKGITGLTSELLRISVADAVISMAVSTIPGGNVALTDPDVQGSERAAANLLRRAVTTPGIRVAEAGLPGVQMVASGDAAERRILIVKGGKLVGLRPPRPPLITLPQRSA
jgi:hypothetical protein